MKSVPKQQELIVLSEEVEEALHSRMPIVALESNVITHGFQYPDNVQVALDVERAVRASGSVPATIAVIDGHIRVGLNQGEIECLGSTPGIPKVSSRDLPIILAQGGIGATTVASSIMIADAVGISFFSSAGIGGVHRGAEKSMDISPDLIQFTRSRVAVVCAGAKSILDLNLTMEFLETHGVPIIAYQSNDFPAFYCVSSGLRSPHRIDDATQLARAIENHWRLGNRSSVLVTSPIAKDEAIDASEIDRVLVSALHEMDAKGLQGNQVTKYLLRAVDEATKGRSSQANRSILVSNAKLAGSLAAGHAECRTQFHEVNLCS